MASARVAFLAISMALLSSVAMATDHVVGDEKGWTTDFDYAQWAQARAFHVDDILVFVYNNSRHNVFKVNATSFQDCTFPEANQALTTGHDIITLKAEGKKWYVCGVADHCAAHQMKLVIDVQSNGPAPAPSAAPPSLLSSLSGVLVTAAMVAIAAIFA